MLLILENHPVQYHAPVYRAAAREIPLVVAYGSDFSVAGYRDREFGRAFAWDTDLMSGYESRFFSKVADGAPASYEAIPQQELLACLQSVNPTAVMVIGYASPFDRGALRIAKHSGRPLLFRGETTDHARRRSWPKRVARDALLSRLYRKFSRLLFVGQRSRDHFRRLGVPEERLIFSP